MLQLYFGFDLRILFLLAIALIIGATILLLAVEFNASPQNKEKLISNLLREHYFSLEATIQTSMIAGIFLVCLLLAFGSDDIVLSIDSIIFPFVILPMFILAIHYRMRYFKDIVEGHTIGLPGATFESLKPTMYARITLVYWIGSLLALLCYFALSILSAPPVFAVVLMHYGLGGLLFFSSPLLFSLSSLRGKPA